MADNDDGDDAFRALRDTIMAGLKDDVLLSSDIPETEWWARASALTDAMMHIGESLSDGRLKMLIILRRTDSPQGAYASSMEISDSRHALKQTGKMLKRIQKRREGGLPDVDIEEAE